MSPKRLRIKEKVDYRFYNYLYALRIMEHQHKVTVTSEEMERSTGILSPTIRKDFSLHLSAEGIRGKGYVVGDLIKEIEGLLGIDQKWDVVLVGIGKIGGSILANKKIQQAGYNIKYAFDNNPTKIGSIIQSIPVQNVRYLKRIIQQDNIRIAVVAVTHDNAQKIVDDLVESGVEGILNMSGGQVRTPEHVMVIELDLSFYLTELSHFITQMHAKDEEIEESFDDLEDELDLLDEEFEQGGIGGS
ncbi:redox-sensing transcriptional repressor Rex [bacterium]|nr:redox-sensing transcriptional repressor Rex [bacterium]